MNTRPSELSTLAAILTDPNTHKCIGQLSAEWFSDEKLKNAFIIIREMWGRREAINLTTFDARWTEQFPETGAEDLISFCNSFRSSNMINSYLGILRDGAVKRMTVNGASGLHDAVNRGMDNDTLIGIVDNLSKTLQNISGTSALPDKETVVRNATDRIMGDDMVEPYFFGLEPVDQNGGYLKDMMLLAARYGIGKTPYALRAVYHNALQKGIPTTIWSGENENEMIVMALMAMKTGIPLRTIKMGVRFLPDEEKKMLHEAQELILDSPLYFTSYGRKDFYDLKSEFMRLHNKYNTEFHVLDQYPHINLNMQIHRNRKDALVDLGNKVFELKKEIPGFWMILDQLRTKNVDDTPALRDVMHSTQLEQNVDIGCILDRKGKERRRIDHERKILNFKIRDIRQDTSLSNQQKAMKVYELEQENVIAGIAHVSQEKGRMGYGEWQTTVGFDDNAYGFYDAHCIREDDPRRDMLLGRLQREKHQEEEEFDETNF